MALGMSTALRNARLDAITSAVGSAGKLRLYAGTRPATGGTTTTLLGEFTCGSPFAGAAASGVLTLNPVAADSAADNTGTATWARLLKSDNTFVMDLDVSVAGGSGDLTMDNVAVVAGATLTPGSMSITDANP